MSAPIQESVTQCLNMPYTSTYILESVTVNTVNANLMSLLTFRKKKCSPPHIHMQKFKLQCILKRQLFHNTILLMDLPCLSILELCPLVKENVLKIQYS